MLSVTSVSKVEQRIARRIRDNNALISAEKILREAQNKYGRTNSATYLELKAAKHKGNPLYADVSEKLRRKAGEYRENLMYQIYRSIAYVQKKPETEALLGDCGECAQAIQKEFYVRQGTPTVNVVMEVFDKNLVGQVPKRNHAFNLSNINPGVQIENPRTWGSGAVITDLWSGIVKKRDDAIDYLKTLFNVNPETDDLVFKAMPDSDISLQKAVLRHLNIDDKKMDYLT